MPASRARTRSPLVAVFAALASSHLVRTASGFLFWVVVARVADAPAVGLAGAVIALVALLSRFTTLGLGSFLMAELPRLEPDRARWVMRFSATVLTGLGLAVSLAWCGVLVVVPGGGSTMSAAVESLAVATLFVLTLVLTSVSSVWDYGALGLGRSSAQLVRNLVASFGRFPVLLVWPALGREVSAVEVLLAWSTPIALSLVVFAVQVRISDGVGTSAEGGARTFVLSSWRASLGHYTLDVALAAGPLLVPVVAAAVLVPTQNGYFTVAWMAASVVFVAPFALATSLFAHSAEAGPDAFAASCRRVLPAGLAISGIGCLGTWLTAPVVFRVFGDDYVASGAPIMTLLVLGGIWMVVKDLVLDWYRLSRRFALATTLATTATVMDVLGALAGGAWWGGGTGVALGWISASLAQALLGAPFVLVFLRRVRVASHPVQ